MKTTVICPNCGTEIDIGESLYTRLEQQAKAKLQEEARKQEARYKKELKRLEELKEDLADKEKRFQKSLQKAVEERTEERLEKERRKLREQIRGRIEAEQREAMESLKKELDEKSGKLRELEMAKIEIERLKRERLDLELKAKADAEAELNRRLTEEKEKLKKALDEETTLKLRAKDEQIAQMKRDIEAARRKAEQGSMQIQGESMETAIEEWIASRFPFDTVEEIKKGAFGADCIQRVNTRDMPNCGTICYESKNTKAWSDSWIPKLKQDMLKVGADIGVIVSSVYPSGMERMGFVDGIWVCSLEEFKGSVTLLRESLIRVHMSTLREENKTDKMTLLYNYLTGNEFQMQLKAIVDGFMQMQAELDKEKRSLTASWKRRQKLIERVLLNTTEMYGSLHGIAGHGALEQIPALELPDDEGEEKLEDWDGCDN